MAFCKHFLPKAVSAICPFPEIRSIVSVREPFEEVMIYAFSNVMGITNLSNSEGGASEAEINELG
jgi:hypothetical protein